MDEWTCPICGQPDCDYKMMQGEFDFYHCKKYDFRFFLSSTISCESDDERRERALNLVTEHLIHSKYCVVNGRNRDWYFFDGVPGVQQKLPEYANVADLMINYPDQVMDKAHRALVNLSILYPNYGDIIHLWGWQRRMVFAHKENNIGRFGLLRVLEDLGYLKDPEYRDNFSITALGWQKIDELRKKEQTVKQGFVAMSFRDETKPIREAFRTAMRESGYSVAVIDEKEHNNQIVPEIFYEIERSKFVVVDVTYPNYGAYYEAGYAQALGKQVIICCRKAEFDDKENKDRPHFDIAQKAMVVWKDENDLVARLKKRIEATVK